MKGRVTKYAAEALLARVWLYYTGAYSKTDLDGLTQTQVITYVEDVVNNSGASLMTNFADVFKVTNKNNIESIFEIQYSYDSKWGDWDYREGSDGNQAVILWGMRDPSGDIYDAGWSFAPLRASLWNEYEATDTRRAATIINTAAEGITYTAGFQDTKFFNKKFTPLTAHRPTDGSRELNYPNNYMCIRFSDVLLMAAELQLTTDAGKAQNYYERVVKRALGSSYTVPTVTKDLLMKERLLELALEGHRYWDLRRQGLNYTKQVIERENGSVGADFQKTFDLKYNGLLPIPQSQITQCKFTQNAGYTN
jgi:phage antirepressor YoqD-like protein